MNNFLDDKQKQRFSRNLLLKEINEKQQLKLLDTKVLIAGVGGLGSGVIANLAGLGITKFLLADKDKVDLSNLNRQFIHNENSLGIEKTISAYTWLKAFNSEIECEFYNFKINSQNIIDVIQKADIVVDCLDNFESKLELNKACVKAKKTLVHAGVEGYQGQIMTITKNSACLNCLFENQEQNVFKGVISPVVNVISSIQALEVFKIVLGLKSSLEDNVLSCNLEDYTFNKYQLAKNKSCKVCGLSG